MLKKYQISQNLSVDGTEEFLDSRKINDAGINVDLIDNRDGSDLEDRKSSWCSTRDWRHVCQEIQTRSAH